MSIAIKQLSNLCKVITKGTTPTSIGYNFSDTGLIFLRVQNINGGQVNYEQQTLFIDELTHKALSRSQILAGDILVSIAGTIGRAGIVPDNAPPLNCNQAVAIVRTNGSIFRSYLRHWLESNDAQSQMIGSTVTGTIANLSLTQIGNLRVPLPPITQQKRIAEILDRTQSLISKRKEAIAKLDTLTQSIFLEMFGDPVKNENNLPVTRLGDLTKISSGSTPSRKIPEYFNGNIPWVKTTEVNGSLITDTEEKITDLALKNSSCHLYPVGSILIALYGQGKTRGQCAVLGIEAATNQACGALLPNASYNTNFLFAQLSMSYNRLRAMARGGNQENLNLGLISDFTVLLPPLPLQKEFAQRVEAVEKLKATHRASLSQLEALFASLQHRAFRGEL